MAISWLKGSISSAAKSKVLVILDAGHGGIVNGEYVTPGKRSPVWSDGFQLFEGENNRHIRWKIKGLLDREGIPNVFLNVGNDDLSINSRVNKANQIVRNNPGVECLLISIHSNGHSNQNAKGWEVWTSYADDESDVFARILFDKAKKKWLWAQMRKGAGDVDKESSNFGILKSKCAVVLSENFFHTNEKECRFIASEKGRREIAEVHLEAIKEWIRGK